MSIPDTLLDRSTSLRRRWGGFQFLKDSFLFLVLLSVWIGVSLQFVHTGALQHLAGVAKLALFWIPGLWLLDEFLQRLTQRLTADRVETWGLLGRRAIRWTEVEKWSPAPSSSWIFQQSIRVWGAGRILDIWPLYFADQNAVRQYLNAHCEHRPKARGWWGRND